MGHPHYESAQVFQLGFPLVSYHREGSLQVEESQSFVHNLGHWLAGENKKSSLITVVVWI